MENKAKDNRGSDFSCVDTSPPAQIGARFQEDKNAMPALAKDVPLLQNQAPARQRQARQIHESCQNQRAQQAQPDPNPTDLLTVTQTAPILGVCKRTLRSALCQPEFAARTQSRTRKSGIFYKRVLLLPPDLVDDLHEYFGKKKPGSSP